MADVRPATTADLTTLGGALTRAFEDDPVMSYVQPDPGLWRRRAPRFWRTVARVAMRRGQVLVPDQGGAGALWLAPGRWKDEPRDLVRQVPLVFTFGRTLPRALRLFAAMEGHHPREPHWYLQTLGTDPRQQGRGLGSALMAPVLHRCDREGVPAYLESSKQSNIPFYERHGFRVTDELVIPAGGPTLWAMWRDPGEPDG